MGLIMVQCALPLRHRDPFFVRQFAKNIDPARSLFFYIANEMDILSETGLIFGGVVYFTID
jgi:hypothetical protein